ncbi:dynamin family protein [Nannocystis pusilla]|uniref:dynamin family protein n=1 Tax=Nannocystis pusilla TaxID=889268 RepID=UPI003BF375F9
MTSSPTDSVSSALLHLADGLRQAADQLGLPRLGAQVLEETKRRLTESRLRVLVLGEIKQGKSTLINAILGEALLPTGVTPTTGAVVQLVRGDATERRLHGAAGSEVLAPERFAELARGKSPIEGSLVVTTTSEQLPPELELIDTPGINDILRLRTLISRGELPRGDALLLVLDATQVLKRTELAFLRDALIAVGGLGDSGATLLLALNRVDLIPEAERPAVLSHIEAQLASMIPGPLEIFQTDARTAAKDPSKDSLGVREVLRLRERLKQLAGKTRDLSPPRARTYLLRNADLLAHHAATLARALRLEHAAVRDELEAVRKAFIEQQLDVEQQRATIATRRAEIVARTREHLANFRGELEEAIFKQLERADLRITAELLPSASQDALMHFVYSEAERLRLALEGLTREVMQTCGEQAQRRLATAMLSLGLRGPVIHIRPPSVFVEAGTLAVGIAGTAVMYFGNIVTGLVMTVAAPLATMVLRERSVREVRTAARESVPSALATAFGELESALIRAVDDHVATLEEILVLAHGQLGDQLQSLLQRVLDLDEHAALPPADPTPTPPASEPVPQPVSSASEARKTAAAELRALEPRLADLRAQIAAVPIAPEQAR